MEALTGRTAVVAGAASGIGRAMVHRFAAEAIVDRQQPSLHIAGT